MNRKITRAVTAALLTVTAMGASFALGASTATADAPRVKAVDVARGKADRAMWHGFTVGQVIVCPKGYDVSIDETRTPGRVWAACM